MKLSSAWPQVLSAADREKTLRADARMAQARRPPPAAPPSRTDWTRLVPPPVLTGQDAICISRPVVWPAARRPPRRNGDAWGYAWTRIRAWCARLRSPCSIP